MKKLCNNLIIKLICIFLILGISGYLLLCMAYSLPEAPMQKNVSRSWLIFHDEGTYPRLNINNQDTQLDNFTDALMLLQSAYQSERHPMVAAVLNESPSIPEKTPVDSLLGIYRDGVSSFDVVTYGRYWHGYEIFLKPLLSVFDYGEIRTILCAVQIALIFCVVGLLVHRKSAKFLLPLGAMWLYLNPGALFMSLQHSNMFILTLASFAVLLIFEEKYAQNRQLWILHFFVVGCLTSYFDLLTYPLITFGVPIAYLLSKYGKSFKDSTLSLVQNSAAWGIGYAGFWAAKWVGGSIVSRTNILADALKTVQFRSGHEFLDKTFSFWEVLKRNLQIREDLLVLVLAVCVLLLLIALLMKCKVKPQSLPLLLVAVYPICWYAGTANHAYVHFWFAFREVGITVFALLAFAVSMERKKPKSVVPEPENERNSNE